MADPERQLADHERRIKDQEKRIKALESRLADAARLLSKSTDASVAQAARRLR